MYLDTFFSTKKSGFNIAIKKLSEKPKYLKQAAIWAEAAWGYLEDFKGTLEDDIKEHADRFYIVTYNNEMIGMFGLYQYHSLSSKLVIDELNYVYIHPNFRKLGFGKEMIERAKEISRHENHADLLILETTNPELNKFYEKSGAKFVCDSRALTSERKVETSFFRI